MVLMYRDGVTPIRVKENEALSRLERGYTLEPKKVVKQPTSDELVAENKAVSRERNKVSAVEKESISSSVKDKETKTTTK